MNKKCPNCNLINFSSVEQCRRCEFDLPNIETPQVTVINQKASGLPRIMQRAVVCFLVVVFCILAFYLSLIFSSAPLQTAEKEKVKRAIAILEERGFDSEVFLLNYLAAYRSNDNWLNASVEKENAYAATNFPFEIMTLYPDFFEKTTDDLERAAILLHEAKHLQGAEEKAAYEFVWRNRNKLGWTKENYGNTKLYQAVKKQTKEYAPNLFICQSGDLGDCTDF
jgi:hypothetical protein